MDMALWIGPAVVAAVVSGIISVVGLFLNRSTTVRLHSEKLNADHRLAEHKVEADISLAKQKFEYDRGQAVFKRRFELAEQLLADAYQFRSIMEFVRKGATFVGEGDSREAEGLESSSVKRSRDNYFVPLERLSKQNEFLAAMFARQPASLAHFVPDAAKAFTLLYAALHEVRASASLLIEWTTDGDTSDRETMKKLRNVIWQPMAKHAGADEVGDKIEEGVRVIEGLCRPVLAWVS